MGVVKRAAELLREHRDVVSYLFFGVCTTLVNILVYYLCAHPLSLPTGASTVVAWVVSVLLAYVTNKLWVFESKSWRRDVVAKEAASFFGCRLATGVFDVVFMMVTVDVLGWNDLAMKIVSNVVVVIANYVASKFVVFRKTRNKDKQR